MKNKIIILLFLLSFPSVFYVILTTGKHNFIHLPFYGEKLAPAKGKDTIYYTVPPFSFVNQDGNNITDKTYDGKIYVADYFYTENKSICPRMAAELLRVQDKFAYTNGTVQLLSLTSKPENDSVPVLKRYADMVHADTKTWTFVTGDKKQLVDLAQNGYLLPLFKEQGTSADLMGSDFFILVDKEKHIRGIYHGTNIKEVNNLLDDIKVLIAEYYIKETKNKKSPSL